MSTKVDGLKWLLFPISPLILRYETRKATTTFLMILGACMNTLFALKVEILLLVKWSYT